MARRSSGGGVSLGLVIVLVLAVIRFVSVMERTEGRKVADVEATWEVAGMMTAMAKDASAQLAGNEAGLVLARTMQIVEPYRAMKTTPTRQVGTSPKGRQPLRVTPTPSPSVRGKGLNALVSRLQRLLRLLRTPTLTPTPTPAPAWQVYADDNVTLEYPTGWVVVMDGENGVTLSDDRNRFLVITWVPVEHDFGMVFDLRDLAPDAWAELLADEEAILHDFVNKNGGEVVEIEQVVDCRVAGREALCFDLLNSIPVRGAQWERGRSIMMGCGELRLCTTWYSRLGREPLSDGDLALVERILSSLEFK